MEIKSGDIKLIIKRKIRGLKEILEEFKEEWQFKIDKFGNLALYTLIAESKVRKIEGGIKALDDILKDIEEEERYADF